MCVHSNPERDPVWLGSVNNKKDNSDRKPAGQC